MINEIPTMIYDNLGNQLKVVRSNKIFFKNENKYGYVFHVEKAEKVSTVSEFELELKNGKYMLKRDIFIEVISV
ncbi:hypothetical protein [Clostridium senegalense]|uniref:Uncharacterized protein n=1 Tax=Clostridium senegalense TaxID=1465809 RepID=A0A6M0H176_9CLOT|nr:hypothetical protein [Clostridium senegalense]NEU03988.1 hypothetical protein [Clostridium senegalense]